VHPNGSTPARESGTALTATTAVRCCFQHAGGDCSRLEQVSSETLVSIQGHPISYLGKVKMSSWFISPWEAARLSLEAQRQVAMLFFPYASRQERQPLEVPSDDKSPVVTHQNVGSSAHLPIPLRSRKTAQAKTVTAHKATQVMRKGTGTRKLKSRKRRTKSDKQRS
jgi:hypothetical protein